MYAEVSKEAGADGTTPGPSARPSVPGVRGSLLLGLPRPGRRSAVTRPELVRVRVYEAAGLPHQRGPSHVTRAPAVGRLAALETRNSDMNYARPLTKDQHPKKFSSG